MVVCQNVIIPGRGRLRRVNRLQVRLAEQLKASRLHMEDLLSLLALRSEVETPDAQDIRIDLLSSNQVIRNEQGLKVWTAS